MSGSPRRTRLGILISGRGSNMAAILDAAARDPDYPADPVLVASNVADAPGLALAAARGVPVAAVPSRGRPRETFEADLLAALDAARVEVLALAGFLRVLTPGFVARWAGRMLNVHPSLLPAFPGLDTHARALARGVRLHGCTVHLVTEGVDEGPILAQAAVPVLPGDTPDALAARVLAQEHRLYPAALAAFLRRDAAAGATAGATAGAARAPGASEALLNPLPP